MKAALLSINLNGGAGGATHRLHTALKSIGVESQVFVQRKDVDDPGIILLPRRRLVKLTKIIGYLTRLGDFDDLLLRLYPDRSTLYWPQFMPDSIGPNLNLFDSDVINLHWVCGSFVQIERVPKFKQPVVWTLHDMWPFTGGCYYSEDCDRYKKDCGSCPQLGSSKDRDLSRFVWWRKARAWKNLDFTLVTPSSWLAECARSSSLLKNQEIRVIPNGIDTKRFRPMDRWHAREVLGLPQDKLLVLFGCWRPSDRRKGFSLLSAALQELSKTGWGQEIELVIFGSVQPAMLADLGVKYHCLGKLQDRISMALVYSSADVFVGPSLLDNLPTTVLEAIACGIPCVAFDLGGLPDIIEHRENGYLAQPSDVEDLARGIVWVLKDQERRELLSQNARAKAEKEYSLELYAQRYLSLFEETVEKHNGQFHSKVEPADIYAT